MSVLADTCRLRTPRGGVPIPFLGEGSGYYSGGPGPLWGSGYSAGVRTSTGGPEPPVVRLSACFSRNTWCSRTFPKQGTGPGPLLGEQGFRSAGVRPLDVVKDDYKALLA